MTETQLSEESFVRCRDLETPLADRLQAFEGSRFPPPSSLALMGSFAHALSTRTTECAWPSRT